MNEWRGLPTATKRGALALAALFGIASLASSGLAQPERSVAWPPIVPLVKPGPAVASEQAAANGMVPVAKPDLSPSLAGAQPTAVPVVKPDVAGSPPSASTPPQSAHLSPDVAVPAPKPAKPERPTIAAARTSPQDRALLKQALASARREWNEARRLAARMSDPVGRVLIEWRYVLDETSDATFWAINAFLKEHPDWPRRDALLARAEKTMPPDMAPRDVIAWYGDRTPASAPGMIRLGDALMLSGRTGEGVDLIRKAWVEGNFTIAEELQIAANRGGLFTSDDHRARLDRLFARDDLPGARRQMARVDAESRRIAEARLRIRESPAAARAVLASLPEAARRNPEVLFDAARALRRNGDNDAAWDLMAQASADREGLPRGERWATERQIMARDALKAGRFDLAYGFAAAAAKSAESASALADSEFLAGWIALRFLHKPELAFPHFQRLSRSVSLPITVARAHYWLGRAADALEQPEEAELAFRTAAALSTTFYGQLALAILEDNPVLSIKTTPAHPTAADRAAFEADLRVRAARLLADIGEREMARLFAIRLTNDWSDPARLEMLAELMKSAGDPAMSVRIAKAATYNDVYLTSYLHPVVPLPSYSGRAPEPALVLGLARQESEFDPRAISSAGARGLMQLMPASAKHAAAKRGVPYRERDLTANPSYNMQLGMALMSEYLERWDGSYVLAIASYNAGPGNVRRWVEAHGDPRVGAVDPVDWIERIPFAETRNYVQRVLENLEVYRNRLRGADQRLAIVADLYRPRPVNLAAWRRPATALAAADSPEGAAALVQDSATGQ